MQPANGTNWVEVIACGSLITGGILLLAGQKRAGLVIAASGAALAMLEHEETLRGWWEALPGYIERAEQMLERAQDVADNVAERGESLRRVLAREPRTTIQA